MSISGRFPIDDNTSQRSLSPSLYSTLSEDAEHLSRASEDEGIRRQEDNEGEQSIGSTIEGLNMLYAYALDRISALKRDTNLGLSASGLAIASDLCQVMDDKPSYISLLQRMPHIIGALQPISSGKVVSLLKKLIRLMCAAPVHETSAPAHFYGRVIIAITKLTDLSVCPALFKIGFKAYINDDDRLLLIQHGFFDEFVAITAHLKSAKLSKYYIWALKADQIDFAEALIGKSDWPRMEGLVPEKSLRQINRLYKRKLLHSERPTEQEWNTIGHILENYQCHGIRVGFAVKRAFEVSEYSAIKRLYRGSNARFDGSSFLGLNLIKGKSQREQYYLNLALLTGEKDVVEHVLSKTRHVPGKVMSDIVSTITTLVYERHKSSDLAGLLEMFGKWGEEQQCARVLHTGRPFRSKKLQNHWRLAGCEYSRRQLIQELNAKLAQSEEEKSEEFEDIVEENAAEFTCDLDSGKDLDDEELARPLSPASDADAQSSGSESGFDSSDETLTGSEVRKGQD